MLLFYLLSLIFGIMVGVLLMSLWGVSLVVLTMVSFISFLMLQHNFSLSVNLMFLNSSLSSLMIFLALFLCFLAIMTTPEEKGVLYMFLIYMLSIILLLTFSSKNLIVFYVLFEASLIMILLLIIGWGYQPERLQAGSYMMLYTVSASLPLFLLIIYWVEACSASAIMLMKDIPSFNYGLIVIVVYAAFLVKLPMYGFHLWLPKAHVEAPLAGSMILAGILLKLGGFGLMQMNKCFLGSIGVNYVYMLICVSMWGGFIATLMCLRQVDVKALVAYSSVNHMGIVAAGFMLDQSWGVLSAIVTMVAHGFSSSALFGLAYFSYKKVRSRSLVYFGGFINLYPFISLFWFIFCCINMAAPPSINLVGELSIMPSLLGASVLLVGVMGLMVFLSAAYNMFLYSSVNHGGVNNMAYMGPPFMSYEVLSLIGHTLPLLVLFKMNIFI